VITAAKDVESFINHSLYLSGQGVDITNTQVNNDDQEVELK